MPCALCACFLHAKHVFHSHHEPQSWAGAGFDRQCHRVDDRRTGMSALRDCKSCDWDRTLWAPSRVLRKRPHNRRAGAKVWGNCLESGDGRQSGRMRGKTQGHAGLSGSPRGQQEMGYSRCRMPLKSLHRCFSRVQIYASCVGGSMLQSKWLTPWMNATLGIPVSRPACPHPWFQSAHCRHANRSIGRDIQGHQWLWRL